VERSLLLLKSKLCLRKLLEASHLIIAKLLSVRTDEFGLGEQISFAIGFRSDLAEASVLLGYDVASLTTVPNVSRKGNFLEKSRRVTQ